MKTSVIDLLVPTEIQVDDKLVQKFAPKIVEGTKRLKAWVEST